MKGFVPSIAENYFWYFDLHFIVEFNGSVLQSALRM
jgi:hypothetical protein